MIKRLKRYIFTLFLILCAGTVSVFAQQQKVTHTVKDDDTLFSISKEYGVSITEIKEWNQLQTNNIALGQELVIYVQNTEDETMIDTSGTSGPEGKSLLAATAPARNTFYTVKSGDNLYNIAQAHGMTLTQLKELNGLTSDVIRVGQKLSVKAASVAPSVSVFSDESTPQGKFAVYTVQRGESLPEILNRFGMTMEEFKALNPEMNPERLARGLKITVLLPPTRTFENPYLQNSGLQNLGQVKISTYSENDIGKPTTSGELYNPDELTAAHSNISIGSIIFVENKESDSGIYLRINDRITSSGLKLSKKAYEALSFKEGSQPQATIYMEDQ